MRKLKKAGLFLIIILYLAAGTNHFWHPNGYIRIIPGWIPAHVLMNILAGICEIIFAVLMLFKPTRRLGGLLIVLMLAAFLPVHIVMLIQAPLRLGALVVTPLIAWIRLLLQPVLMYWAWWQSRE